MTSHMPMSTSTRQPFAPLNASRLQNLTSHKNRQNAVSSTAISPSKRKATIYESDDDSENVDPLFFDSPKRSKAAGINGAKDTHSKPPTCFLTKAPPSPTDAALTSPLKPTKSVPVSQRKILQPRSQTPKTTTSAPKPSSLTAPAGRSPSRKRVGILNSRRRTSTPITRVDPPRFSTSKPSGLGFSIDAALSGTIPSYGARQRQRQALSSKSSTPSSSSKPQVSSKTVPDSLHESEGKSSWFFQIHEDTEEELATNLMEHSTCTLDLSSDEESRDRLRDQRGKENVPPMDDISQTRVSLTASASSLGSISRREEREVKEMKMRIKQQQIKKREAEEGAIDVDRAPLGEMRKEDFYADGCDEKSVFVILPDPEPEVVAEAETVVEGEEEVQEKSEPTEHEQPLPESGNRAYTSGKGKGNGNGNGNGKGKGKGKGKGEGKDVEDEIDIEGLMQKRVVEPIERPEVDFVVWESGSSKGEGEKE